MDTSKVSPGEMIAAISGLALFIILFLPWYGLEASTDLPGGDDFSISGGSASAWEAFSFVDILLFLVAVIVVGLVLARAAESMPDLPQPPAVIIAAAGALAVLLVLFRLIVTPGEDVDGLGVEIDVTRKVGAFLGLIAAGGIAYGGWRAMNEAPATAGPADRVGGTPPPPPAQTPPPPPAASPADPPPAAAPQTPPAPPENPPQGGTQSY